MKGWLPDEPAGQKAGGVALGRAGAGGGPDVVETDHRHVAGHRQARIVQRLDGPKGQQVAGGEHRVECRAAAEDGSYQLERNTNGWFSFRIVGAFGDTLGSSAPHPDPGSLGLTIARIKALLPDAEVILP